MLNVNLSLAQRTILGLQILNSYTIDEEHIVTDMNQIWAGPEFGEGSNEYDGDVMLPIPVLKTGDVANLTECGWYICPSANRWTIHW